MTKEEAIKELKKLDDWIDKHPSLLEDWMKTSNALYMAIQALESQRWIPVSERLPEDCEAYLVCTDGGYIATIVYDPHGLGWLISDNIIAWQELPQPYKSESEDAEC